MDVRGTIGGIFLLGIGLLVFFKGFKKFRQKRLVEDIPTSTVRGMAMGMVEVIGKAIKNTLLQSPFTHTECVFYRYQVEKYKKSGKSSQWVTVLKGDSSATPFYVEDTTGRILIMPKGAQFLMPVDYKKETGSFSSIPQNLESFLQANNVSYKGLFGLRHRLRFQEWVLKENDPVYVLGTAQKSTYHYHERFRKIKMILNKMKRDPKSRKKIDLNKDGEISEKEERLAEKKVGQALHQRDLKVSQTGDVLDVAIGKGHHNKTFIISDQSQKDVIKQLQSKFWVSIIVGGLVATFGLFLLLLQLNLFRLIS
jgi:hypothetical protein